MAAINSLDGLFKNVFGDATIRAVPDFAKIQKRVKFSQKEKTGDFYEVPVLLAHEHGFSYYADGNGTATNLNAAIAGSVVKARIQGNMIVLRSQLSYEDVYKASSASAAAFESAIGLVVDNMQRSFAKRLELSFIYGRRGIGQVASVASNVITITDASWAGGIWSGMKDSVLSFWSSQDATATERDGSEDWDVDAVDFAAKTVTVVGSSSGTLAAVTADDHIYFDGSVANSGARTATAHNECAGLDLILSNTGTLFNISAATFELWQANTRAIAPAAEMSMLHALDGISDAVVKGLQEDAVLWLSPVNWNGLNADQAALRRYGAEITSSAKTGTKNIVYYSTNGSTELEAHPFYKDGEAHLIPNPAKRLVRVGATNITFRRPGMGSTIVRELTDSAGFELRAFSDQAILLQVPGHATRFTGILAPS